MAAVAGTAGNDRVHATDPYRRMRDKRKYAAATEYDLYRESIDKTWHRQASPDTSRR